MKQLFESTYWFAYRIDLFPEGRSDAFRLTFGYWQSSAPGDGDEVRCVATKPTIWMLKFSEATLIPRGNFGASEPLGLFGGVANPGKLAITVDCERAIGDAFLQSTLGILDNVECAQPVLVCAFGPAMPKVVGRIAAIRPARNVQFLWLTPERMPDWISTGIQESQLLVPPYDTFDACCAWGAADWDDESLIVGWRDSMRRYATESIGTLFVQMLAMWDTSRVDALKTGTFLRKQLWLPASLLPGQELPPLNTFSATHNIAQTLLSQLPLLPLELTLSMRAVHLAADKQLHVNSDTLLPFDGKPQFDLAPFKATQIRNYPATRSFALLLRPEP